MSYSCDPMDCSLPGSSVPGILQARILEGVAIPFSRRSFWPRDWTQVSCIAGRILYRLSHQESPKTLNDPEVQVWLPRNTCGCSWPDMREHLEILQLYIVCERVDSSRSKWMSLFIQLLKEQSWLTRKISFQNLLIRIIFRQWVI